VRRYKLLLTYSVMWHWQIARMLTVKREREIERGIGLRESRKLDREWKRNIVIRPPPSYAATLAEQEKK
jgi:large subunit ribosomal protein L29